VRAAFTAEEAASHWFSPTRDAALHAKLTACIRRLWGRESCVQVRCGACTFGFAWPHVGGDAEYYGILHQSAGYMTGRWEYGVTIDRARATFPSGGGVLDIGAGDGRFLAQMPAGWSRFATESTDVMRETLQRRGVTVFPDLGEAVGTRAGGMHLVTAFQVVEHIADFRPLFRAARELLAPRGLFAVSVPHGDELFAQMRVTACPDMPPNHVNQWTPASMARALDQCGFDVAEAITEPPDWKWFSYNLYLRVRSDGAWRPRSLAARAYRVKNRRIRGPLLAAVGVLTLPSVLPHLGDMRRACNFLTIARARG
jgi:2-polyprenyl-3-methyl-5-hydroxy-6-metoxy-1,4-benzoquinol methylase